MLPQQIILDDLLPPESDEYHVTVDEAETKDFCLVRGWRNSEHSLRGGLVSSIGEGRPIIAA